MKIEDIPIIKFFPIESKEFTVHGLHFFEDSNNLDRLGKNHLFDDKTNVLRTHPSGAYLAFETNTTKMILKVKLKQSAYLANMSTIGQAGFDLYVKYRGKHIFLTSTNTNQIEYEKTLFSSFKTKLRQFRLYLPLYVPVDYFEVGIDNDAIISPIEPIAKEKIVCYGTSITQGGCATRPGMNYSSIIGRTFDYEVLNLGFSGNAHLQLEISELIANIPDIKFLIVEVDANAGDSGALVLHLDEFISRIKLKHPNTKIIIISHFPYTMSLFHEDIKIRFLTNKKFDKEMALKHDMIFVDGYKILKSLNYEETVDGTHLTDLGFYFLAKAITKIIKKY